MKIHLNGHLVDECNARISVFDRGFLFGDGVYELIRFFDGYGVGLDTHAARLQRSLALARIEGFDTLTLTRLCREVLDANDLRDGIVYLQITRGCASTRAHVPTTPLTPTVVLIATVGEPLASLIAPQEIRAITAEDLRWKLCEIKTISLMGNILHLLDADASGASEAILHRDGFVGEGAYSNMAMMKDGVLITSPIAQEPPILHGTARADLLAAAKACGVATEVRKIRLAELETADELMITSSRRFVSAVTRLNDRPVGSGVAGITTHALFCAMRDEIASHISARTPSAESNQELRHV